MEPGATTSPAMSDEAATSVRIERLLEEVRATVAPLAWTRVDELVTAIVDLYGCALGRMLEAVAPDQRAALAADELVGSLMALHALHPEPPEARIRGALAALAPSVGTIELVALDGGVARLQAIDAPPVDGAGEAIERVVLEAAPELVGVEIAGLRAPAKKGTLVQLDVARSRGRASGG